MLLFLKQQRIVKNITQQQVANLVGITPRYYQYIEQGKHKPSVDVAKKIGEVLEIDWTKIYAEETE